MTLNLVLNNNNVVSGSNNTRYRYKFTAPLEIQDEAEMTIANITMPYSWFNITKVNQNNTFTFYFPNASSIPITLPDGYYSVDDINAYIQQLTGNYIIQADDFLGTVIVPSQLAVSSPTIYFTTPFTSKPVIVASVYGNGVGDNANKNNRLTLSIINLTASSFKYYLFNSITSDVAAGAYTISYIAIGTI